MKSTVIISVLVFLLILGFGLFIGYLNSVKETNLPPAESTLPSSSELLQKQHEMAEEAEKRKKATLEDYEYQIKKSKEMLEPTTPFRKF